MNIILFFLIITLTIMCSTVPSIRTYPHSNKINKSIENLKESADKIEKEITYEVYFKLEKDINCLKIEITSSYIANEFTGKRESLKTFFIIDQMIDISKFSEKKEQFIHSEIGKNYDVNWERKKEITVCVEKNDPVMKLKKDLNYRIRFSNFNKFNSEYEIQIHADCRVFYLN